MILFGIDYGSKLAGTTVIAEYRNGEVNFHSSKVKKDADAFVLKIVEEVKPSLIGLDAPLSLPGKFRELPGLNDYAYRQCDRQLKAMSPMFIGGLTARAMRLREKLEHSGCAVIETYPAEWARRWQLKDLGYKKSKKSIPGVLGIIAEELPFSFSFPEVSSWHHLDSLLCLWSALRHQQGSSESYGIPSEGLIWV
jgi:predicted nuclease with RNAse H fold